MNSLSVSICVLAVAAVCSFLAGVITRNYSHVDRLWSILPPVFVLVWFAEFGAHPVFLLVGIPVVLWGIRLTWNFARRGGYAFDFKRGFYEEDYRWAIVRKKIPNRFLFEVFNLFFIAGFQLGLIFLFTLPVYFSAKYATAVTPPMIAIAGIQCIFLVLETIADNQQFAFHATKTAASLGFNTRGLWKYSRHPNYVCEMGQWVCVALYAVCAIGEFHWSAWGAVLLIALFMGSSIMAESITASKYSEYAEWKKATPPWLPFFDYPLRAKSRTGFFKKYGNRV